MIQRLVAFSDALRQAGVPVGLSETSDAAGAIEHIDIADRSSLRAALAASLVKTEGHRAAFDTLFELFFLAGGGPDAADDGDVVAGRDPDEVSQAVLEALMAGDVDAAGALAREAVGSFGRLDRSRSKD